MANVGVHSYIISSSTSSYILWPCKNRIFSYISLPVGEGSGMLLAGIELFFLFRLVLASLLWILLNFSCQIDNTPGNVDTFIFD